MSKSSLGRILVQKFRENQPAPENAAVLEDLKKRVRESCAQAANKAELEFFGSYASGFCRRGADADFSFTWRNYNHFQALIPQVNEKSNKKMLRFSSLAADNGMQHVRYVKARIPVVGFVDSISDLSCDVTVGNVGGVENSKILNLIRQIHPDVIGCYVNTVKEWAKAREVIAPDRGSFNSFTVTTMAVMVLQELGIVPIFSTPTGLCGELTLQDAETAIAAHSLPPIYKSLTTDEQIGEAVEFLFQGFATYYSKFDFTNGTVSLLFPRRLRKEYQAVSQQYLKYQQNMMRDTWESWYMEHKKEAGDLDENAFRWAVKNEVDQRPVTTPFVVEDFVNYINCGRRVHQPRLKPMLDEFKRLGELMQPQNTTRTYEEIFKEIRRFPLTHKSDAKDPRVHRFDRD